MNDVRRIVEDTVQTFVKEHAVLLENDTNEQALSHQLASLLAPRFQDWDVDCEYNRNGETIKRLRYALVPNGEVSDRNVVPDIIIHHRRTDENLVAIEVKKSTNKEPSFKDHAKLQAFREQLGYTNCLFVRFESGTKEPRILESAWIGT